MHVRNSHPQFVHIALDGWSVWEEELKNFRSFFFLSNIGGRGGGHYQGSYKGYGGDRGQGGDSGYGGDRGQGESSGHGKSKRANKIQRGKHGLVTLTLITYITIKCFTFLVKSERIVNRKSDFKRDQQYIRVAGYTDGLSALNIFACLMHLLMD